jgi:hypothetical protein
MLSMRVMLSIASSASAFIESATARRDLQRQQQHRDSWRAMPVVCWIGVGEGGGGGGCYKGTVYHWAVIILTDIID